MNIGDPVQSTYRLTAPACEISSLDQLQKIMLLENNA
jgi:hypothetical protein